MRPFYLRVRGGLHKGGDIPGVTHQSVTKQSPEKRRAAPGHSRGERRKLRRPGAPGARGGARRREAEAWSRKHGAGSSRRLGKLGVGTRSARVRRRREEPHELPARAPHPLGAGALALPTSPSPPSAVVRARARVWAAGGAAARRRSAFSLRGPFLPPPRRAFLASDGRSPGGGNCR